MTSIREPFVRFSVAEDERLIDMVAQHPVLWNMRSVDFKDHVKKDRIWTDLGQALNKSGVQCKMRWKSIRDHYIRQRRQERCSQAAAKRKRASYWSMLDFLDALDDEQSHFSSSWSLENRQLAAALSSELVDGVEIEGEDATGSLQNSDELCLSKALKLIKKDRSSESVADLCSGKPQDHPEDDIDLFFKAMASTVRKFSPADRIEVKRNIFNIVTETEVRMMTKS